MSYTKQLEALNDWRTPEQLFNDIDALLTAYDSIKREYYKQWNKYESSSTTKSAQGTDTFTNTIKRLQSQLKQFLSDIANIKISNPKQAQTHKRNSGKKSKKKKEYKRRTSRTSRSPSVSPILVPISSVSPLENDGSESEEKELSQIMTYTMTKRVTMQSVRSFGVLFSKEFQLETSSHYKKSIAVQPTHFFPQNKIKDGDKTSATNANNDGDEAPSKQMKVVQYFHDNYYGQNEVFESPFGLRPVIYCDWTASGKSLACVEQYLATEVLTLYANTHTTTSITGIQTSKFRSEARSIICESLKGDAHQDVVIFTGSGVTGAIYKMSHILMNSISKSYKPESTLVFISVYEHNSNIYIWMELGIKVIVIPEDKQKGGLDLQYLERKLKLYASSHLKNKYNLLIGSFTAASNVSGIIAPIDETTLLLHKYGALSFWDYATAGPYLEVKMTNKENPMLSKDAVFISTHKYLAGPGAPGILCAKKKLFQNYVPVVAGGGTVFAAFGISDGDWEYLDNIEEREEGGTPDIIGSVRAAFAFMIKDHLSTKFIEEREEEYLQYFLSETRSYDNLVMVGNSDLKCHRLPVLSFMITHTQKNGFGASSTTKYLHYNFIAALLNDLFGIQGRGGCACAGMYGVHALGMDENEIDYVFNQMRREKNELARPGYFRINLHYTLNKRELKYIVKAVQFICKYGWKFLPLYDVNKETGNYFHREITRKPELLKKQLRSLLDVSFSKSNGCMIWKKKHMRVDGKTLDDNLDKFFVAADDILNNLHQYLPSKDGFASEDAINDEVAWYWLPSQIYSEVLRHTS